MIMNVHHLTCACVATSLDLFLVLSQQEDAIDIQTTLPVNQASLVFWLVLSMTEPSFHHSFCLRTMWLGTTEQQEQSPWRVANTGKITLLKVALGISWLNLDLPSALQTLNKGLTLVITLALHSGSKSTSTTTLHTVTHIIS